MKSLLMKSEMILAYNAGLKTQTRRIIWPQPVGKIRMGAGGHVYFDDGLPQPPPVGIKYSKPKLTPGEQFYFRETWGSLDADHPSVKGGRKPQKGDRLVYRADPASDYQWGSGKPSQGNFVWRSPLLMPEWAARYRPKCTGVSAGRLQDISEADAIAEGIEFKLVGSHKLWRDYSSQDPAYGTSPVLSYRSLWNSINLEPKPVYGPGKVIVGYLSFPWSREDFAAAYAGSAQTGHFKSKPLQVIPNPWVFCYKFTEQSK